MKRSFIFLLLMLLGAAGLDCQTSLWIPAPQTSWQWQLTTPVDLTVNASAYDIDIFDNSASVVSALHAAGRKAICYIDFGTWENWRPDAGKFPSTILGNSNGWPGEKWMDIRRIDILGPIMTARLSLCKSKGFDAVEPDNIDGYSNSTGFPLTSQDQLTYNKWIAAAAHAQGLSVGLKNDVDQAADLEPYFDWTLNEQCFEYQECSTLTPFTQHAKAVFNVEYNLSTSQFCSSAISMGFNSMQKDLNLDAWRVACNTLAPKGTLSGVVSSSALSVNLTAEGNKDWVHWGDSSLIRKAGVTAKIGNATALSGSTVYFYGNDPRPMGWTDGTPTASATNNFKGIFTAGLQHGFSVTAPAGTSIRTMTVHVGGWNSGGTLTAHLSDGSAADFVDVTAIASGQYDRNYILKYTAATAGQTLTVTWKMTSGTGNVTLNAAALSQ